MSFTHALHYPWIDIRDPGWLKSAALYWDRISTIVPRSVENPYSSIEARVLQDEGVLTPLVVEPDMVEVDQASLEFETYSRTPESLAVLLPPGSEVADEKWHVREDRKRALLHPEKMSSELRDMLVKRGLAREMGDWLQVPRDAANCYMTILAANLAQNRGLALLSDEERFEPLAILVRRGKATDVSVPGAKRLGEAMLAHLALQAVNITPDTPVEKVIRFRNQHRDELGHFRQAIGNLASQLDEEFPSLEAFQQQVRDVYVNELEPAINNLRASLRAAHIRSYVSSLKTLVFASPITLLPTPLLTPALGPLAAPVALFAGATCSIIANRVAFHLDKQQLLRENPYSYVLAAHRTFGEYSS